GHREHARRRRHPGARAAAAGGCRARGAPDGRSRDRAGRGGGHRRRPAPAAVPALHERGRAAGGAGAELLLLSQPAPGRRADPRQPAQLARRARAPLPARAGAAGRRHAVDPHLRAARLGRDASGGPESPVAPDGPSPPQHRDARARLVTRAAPAAALLLVLLVAALSGPAVAARPGGTRPWVFDKLVGAREFIKGGASEIAGVRVVDDGTVELRLERPFAPFLHLMAYDAASIVPREETDKRGAGFASHPVGTGAFR